MVARAGVEAAQSAALFVLPQTFSPQTFIAAPEQPNHQTVWEAAAPGRTCLLNIFKAHASAS